MALFFKKKKNEEVNVPGVKDEEDMTTEHAADDEEEDDTPDDENFFTKLFHKNKKRKEYTFEDNPHLQVLRPQEAYLFHSDYFQYDDDNFGCVLALFHNEASIDKFPAFWGLDLLPRGLPREITIVRLEQVHRLTDEWVQQHQTRAESVAQSNAAEQSQGGTNTTKRKAGKATYDLETIAAELADGAVYLHVNYRLLVKAPTLDMLDEAVDAINKQYVDCFSSLSVAAYDGDQKKELSSLLRKNESKPGKGFYYTSTEYAGCYNIVTHGIEDVNGEYVGFMRGDVNNSAILFDVDNYKKLIVLADNGFSDEYERRVRRMDIWGSKIAQSCLLNNHKVVHFLLGACDLDTVSPAFRSFTKRVNMNVGDLNMFEAFGSHKDELALFPRQIEKIRIMTEQISPPNDEERAILRGSLEEVLTQFYIDARMWVENAQHNRDRIRFVGLPHKQVPKLQTLVSELNQKHKELLNASTPDQERIHAYGVLSSIFKSMLTNNGDLFDTITSSVLDDVTRARRVIYDFSQLGIRGSGIAMAQTVNIINYALSGLSYGDVAIFHCTDEITSDDVKKYLQHEFDSLYKRGGRICLLYNDVSKYMKDLDFNQAIRADYTILGCMSPADADSYERQFGVALPRQLKGYLTQTHSQNNYLHRGIDNIIFQPDLYVGVAKTNREEL